MSIHAKIIEVMRRVHGVAKDATNTHAKYKYAGHEAVTEALRDHFAELGIVRHPSVVSCETLEGGVIKIMAKVTYVDSEDGTFIECCMPSVQPSQTKEKTFTAQQLGQALSYAVKNIEFKLFCLTGDPDPDSDSYPTSGYEAPPRVEHPIDRQKNTHKQAASTSSVVLKRSEIGPHTTRPNAMAAAKDLAADLKQSTYDEGQELLRLNMDWIDGLPPDWVRRLESIVEGRPQQPPSGRT
jgi:hypothetical protein